MLSALLVLAVVYAVSLVVYAGVLALSLLRHPEVWSALDESILEDSVLESRLTQAPRAYLRAQALAGFLDLPRLALIVVLHTAQPAPVIVSHLRRCEREREKAHRELDLLGVPR